MQHEASSDNLNALLSADYIDQSSATLKTYSSDMSQISGQYPLAIAFPTTTTEVAELVRNASAAGVSLFPRGSGTGLVGGAVPTDKHGIVISTEKMNNIKEFNQENNVVHAQSGVITQNIINLASSYGLFFPSAPNSSSESTIGGNILHNSSGPRSYKYGATRNFVYQIEVVIGTGEVLRLGDPHFRLHPGYNLLDLFIGSEGTLGIVTEVWLKLLPEPAKRSTLIVEFADLTEAFRAVQEISKIDSHISAIDFIGRDCVLEIQSHSELNVFSDYTNHLVLIEVEYENACTELRLFECIDKLSHFQCSHHLEHKLERQHEIWSLRSRIFHLMKAKYNSMRVEDICIPINNLPLIGQEIDQAAAAHDVNWTAIGNIGEGNLHVAALGAVNPSEASPDRQLNFLSQVVDLSLQNSGQISFEHGIGLKKKATFEDNLPKATLNLHRDIKSCFDPKGIFNPGKIFDV